MKVFDTTLHSLENALHYSTKANEAISNNIANIDTPNYKAQNVSFKSILEDESTKISLKQTNVNHLPASGSEKFPHGMMTNRNTSYNHNGNNVDMDKEMAKLAENQIFYRSLVDRINGKFQTLQTVVRGGK